MMYAGEASRAPEDMGPCICGVGQAKGQVEGQSPRVAIDVQTRSNRCACITPLPEAVVASGVQSVWRGRRVPQG